MCGLTGFWNRRRDQTADQLTAVVSEMSQTLQHRGPDDGGVWCDASTGIALGHRRLSIVDLSPAGHQPMQSHCGRYVIAYNGEIYNHAELRRDLVACGHSFRGHSDTEVLVEGFSEWGIEATIKRSHGMFAIATWDTREQSLNLIRDRLGKKPLYYGQFQSTVLFGSELKSLLVHPQFVGEIDRQALAGLLRWSYVRHPGTIYRDVWMQPPGTILRIQQDRIGEPVPYWSLTEIAVAGLEAVKDHPPSFDDAVTRLDELLTDAVGCRMVADVPLGAFLSGGIDSSLVVALMQKQSVRPVKTFTIGFDEPTYNEAPYAARVAAHLQTDHTELYISSQQARDVIPELPTVFDEPFADSSQIPTLLVSRLARRHVTVALSGDGGDEVFCGYRRYFEAMAGFNSFSSGAAVSDTLPAKVIGALRRLPHIVNSPLRVLLRGMAQMPIGRTAQRFRQLANVLSDSSPMDRFLRNLSHWSNEDSVVVGVDRRADFFAGPVVMTNLQQVFQWYDTLTYLPDDILTKVDRSSMAVSLEARAPLLDHRVVEFAWALPHELQAYRGQGKRILREVLSKYVPQALFERPKVGFGVPIGAWLRGPLREWAEDLLDEGRLRDEGYLNPDPVRRKWSEHVSGRGDWHYLLWDVLMFQAWLRHQRNRN